MRGETITPEEWAEQYDDGNARTKDMGYSHATRLSLTPRNARTKEYEGVYIVTDMRKPRYDVTRYEVVSLQGAEVPDRWKKGVRVHNINMTPEAWNEYTRAHATHITVSDIDWCYVMGGEYLIAIEEKHNGRYPSRTQVLTYTSDLRMMSDYCVIPILIEVNDAGTLDTMDTHYEVITMDMMDYRRFARGEDELRETLNSLVYDYQDAYQEYLREREYEQRISELPLSAKIIRGTTAMMGSIARNV